MSLETIMNASGALGHAQSSLVSGGVFTITSPPSALVLPGGAGVHRGPLLYTFAGGSAVGFVDGTVTTVIPQTILPTAEKVLADGLPVVRFGDSGEMAAIGTLIGGLVVPGAPASTGPVVGLVEVADAGQDKVSAQ